MYLYREPQPTRMHSFFPHVPVFPTEMIAATLHDIAVESIGNEREGRVRVVMHGSRQKCENGQLRYSCQCEIDPS
jgi:hypothetical protein